MKRNSDESLRRLEREYVSTRDDDVRLRLIQERLRAGALDPMRVRLAAALGDLQAIAVGLPRWNVRFGLRDLTQADREGWGFFESTYGIEIERVDDPENLEEGRRPYRTDDAVHDDLVRRARQGDVFAMRALRELQRHSTAAYQETIIRKELHRILKENDVEYGDYAADSMGWDTGDEVPRYVKEAAAAATRHAQRDLVDSFLGLPTMRKNPDEDLRELEREAQIGDVLAIEKWLAARRRKEPDLFERLAEGREPEVTSRLLRARVEADRPNADRELRWLHWVGFEPATHSRERLEWTVENFEDNLAALVADHPVLAGLLAYEIVDKEINVETNGYEVATHNTALVDRLMKLSGEVLVRNLESGKLSPDARPASDQSIRSMRLSLREILQRGEEAIEEDLDTVTYGKVVYGDELFQFPNVAGAVVSLADFVATGRREHLGAIAETAAEIRGMEYFSEDEFKEFLDKARTPVIRRVLESGPVLGVSK
jgi:hypothetical protein